MISATTDGLPPPTLDAYTPQQLIRIINNGAQVGREHPQYAQVRQIMTDAIGQLNTVHHAQNQADQQAMLASNRQGPFGVNPYTSAAVNFGQGASLGLLGENSPIPFLRGAIDPSYLNQARAEHPLASGIGEAGGMGALMGIAAPAVAALGPVGGGTLLGGALGATQGTLESKPGMRGAGAVVGGLGGAAGGLAGGIGAKVVGGVVRSAGKVLAKALGRVPGTLSKAGAAGAAATSKALAEAERDFGEPLTADAKQALMDYDKGKISGEDLRTALDVAAGRPLAPEVPPQVRTQSGGVTTELPPGKMSPVAGTEGRGFEVTGERTTPPIPKSQTILEIQERLASISRRPSAAPPVLPQPSGGATLQAPSSTPATPPPFAMSRELTWPVRDLEQRLGRALTPQERELILQDKLQELSRRLQAKTPTGGADEMAARARTLQQHGFSAADARDMAQQGTQVPRDALEGILGRRLAGNQQWR